MLKFLHKSDLRLILTWRNKPIVRKAMYSQHEISWKEHQAWFVGMQADASKKWFLYFDQNNVPNGVVYLTSLDVAQRSAFWGFYAGPDALPGTGLRMSLDTLNKAFNELGLEKLNADVLITNCRSLNMHKKVGFIEEGCFREQFFDGEQRVDVIRLGMLVNEWPSNRLLLTSKIDSISG